MNFFEKIITILQAEMERPQSYGWFHLLWILLSVISIIYLYLTRKKDSENRLILITSIYGITSLILELTKQIIWSYNNGIWDYQWYAFPFQLCTTPIYVTLIYPYIKNKNIKEHLLSYLAFFTILGGFLTMLIPDSCFVKTIEVNIYTMFLHCGSFVVSVYILMCNHINITLKNLLKGFKVFIIFCTIALLANLIIYNVGILNGETFNMFYISPYFISVLPVFDIIQKNTPYLVFLISYITFVFTGGLLTLGISKFIKKIYKNKTK